MPFFSVDILESRKRRWHDEDEDAQQHLYHHFYSTDADQQGILVLNQHHHHARKVLPLSKRTRLVADDTGSVHDHKKRLSEKTRPTSLTPCHICHLKPTKKSHLDSFADCEGCGQRTCFVCIRECQGRNAGEDSILSEQEVLSRSFHMDDAPPLIEDESDAQEPEKKRKGWDAGGHRSVVCSRCCVERGNEGDVACLGCLSRMEGV